MLTEKSNTPHCGCTVLIDGPTANQHKERSAARGLNPKAVKVRHYLAA